MRAEVVCACACVCGVKTRTQQKQSKRRTSARTWDSRLSIFSSIPTELLVEADSSSSIFLRKYVSFSIFFTSSSRPTLVHTVPGRPFGKTINKQIVSKKINNNVNNVNKE